MGGHRRYFHTIPFLLWHTGFPVPMRVALLVAIEFSWNVYPSTPLSSTVLHVSHLVTIAGLWLGTDSAMSAAVVKGKKSL